MKVFIYIGIAALVALACFLGSKHAEITVSEDYGAKNGVLQRECDSLRVIVNTLQTDRKTLHAETDSLQQVINEKSIKITENRNSHEKDIVRIDAMCSDSLYMFFTGYISRQ